LCLSSENVFSHAVPKDAKFCLLFMRFSLKVVHLWCWWFIKNRQTRTVQRPLYLQ
jgi:hypothetical protein